MGDIANTAISAGAGVLGAAASIYNNERSINFERENAEAQRQWNEKMFNAQNEWSLNMWNKTNEYNSPVQQIARLREAGLNPLYYGLDGTSANALESAQPLGYERASAPNLENPVTAGANAYSTVRSMQKDVELKNAEIDKLKSDTRGQDLDNEWKDKTMNARVEAENLSNELTKQNIEKIKKEIPKIEAEIEKIKEETNTEIEKQAVLQAEKALKDGQLKEILELLPYKKLLMDAQTDAQKASAAAAYMHAAYEKGLIDAGYIDKLVKECQASIDLKEAQKHNYDEQAVGQEIENSLKNGTFFGNGWLARNISGPFLRGATAFNSAVLPVFKSAATLGLGVAGVKAVGKSKNRPSPVQQSTPNPGVNGPGYTADVGYTDQWYN